MLNSGCSFTVLAGFMYFIAVDLSPNPVPTQKAKNFKILIRSKSGEIAKIRSNQNLFQIRGHLCYVPAEMKIGDRRYVGLEMFRNLATESWAYCVSLLLTGYSNRCFQ